MKKQIMLNILFLFALTIMGNAQTEEYAASILKMQKLNGSLATYDMIFNQLKKAKPNVSDSAWTVVKKDVYDIQVEKLNQQLIPVYQKHFTLDDIKALIAFYESPIGKKLAEKTPLITGESMQISQKWGMALMQEIQSYLDKRGLDKPPFGIQKMKNNK
jgi:hypothetical protein